jgi:hypothetical protein
VDKSWIVVGPVRTGSRTIVRSIYCFLHKYNFSIINKINPNDAIRPIKPLDVIHTHDLSWLDQVTENTEVIISTRNPVESALSWCILPKLGSYHFYIYNEEVSSKVKSIEIKKFYLNPNSFLEVYNNIVTFYKNLQLKNNYRIIDYSEWSDDPTQIFHKLNFNIEHIKYLKYLPIKNPGSPDQWIENWEEISEICKSLPTNAISLIPNTLITHTFDES